MSKPRLLDLFCGAGGAAMGYHRAGFEVVGIDIRPQPNYPFEFHQADALAMTRDVIAGCWHEGVASKLPGRLAACLGHFDAIHASPPCQAYGSLAAFNKARWGSDSTFPMLIEPTRDLVTATGLPFVIENVLRAPLRRDLVLCGSMFGLRVRRHRVFETNALVMCAHRCHHRGHDFVGVFGDHPGGGLGGKGHPDGYERAPRASTIVEAREAMGIDWMDWDEITESIPPAYTEFIGEQLLTACPVSLDSGDEA